MGKPMPHLSYCACVQFGHLVKLVRNKCRILSGILTELNKGCVGAFTGLVA